MIGIVCDMMRYMPGFENVRLFPTVECEADGSTRKVIVNGDDTLWCPRSCPRASLPHKAKVDKRTWTITTCHTRGQAPLNRLGLGRVLGRLKPRI